MRGPIVGGEQSAQTAPGAHQRLQDDTAGELEFVDGCQHGCDPKPAARLRAFRYSDPGFRVPLANLSDTCSIC